MDPALVPVPLIFFFFCDPMVRLLSTLISNPARSQEGLRIQSNNFCNFHPVFLFTGFYYNSLPHLIFKYDLIIILWGLFSWLSIDTFLTYSVWRRTTEPLLMASDLRQGRAFQQLWRLTWWSPFWQAEAWTATKEELTAFISQLSKLLS